ncbi:Nematode Specific Peptide family, group C [Caenorhabditis elegans]|uniref:Nematode Specific Peptide family, group C n=1 Tax=Caenorhabditis elegans TaxID=6239 RepID=G5ECP8_CAEEL|nr:Nematode Specific Peptide family, group C [Caenorhabditis elegans]NP_510417.1 Nematode Specific Peptide family, group C [Caenorhabditis elegans]CAB05471.1 Nematode Specific Peptide family, group C [Caenorhabditis elegans]CAC42279.1 Nematode Specific Peptide family, group C [Caenorhabditis elegans]|eukprot:NP_510416.1 Nematode Specific Peptide family, group C [Caenorhabditis elegans]
MLALRILAALCFLTAVATITLNLCQEFCAGVNGGESYENCSPWLSYATAKNKTCYNLCVHNCAAVYDGSCINDRRFKCCLATFPAKKQEFKMTGCNRRYLNLD